MNAELAVARDGLQPRENDTVGLMKLRAGVEPIA